MIDDKKWIILIFIRKKMSFCHILNKKIIQIKMSFCHNLNELNLKKFLADEGIEPPTFGL